MDTVSLYPECLLPVDIGPCSGLYPRFYFDSEDKTCEQFTFGGCGGNRNNFMSQEMCENMCRHYMVSPQIVTTAKAMLKTTELEEIPNVEAIPHVTTVKIKEPAVTSKPKELIETTDHPNKIVTFIPFDPFISVPTESQPINTAAPVEPPLTVTPSEKEVISDKTLFDILALNEDCLLPVDIGPCSGVYNRAYFNTKSKKCEEFVYGGCSGNTNNFMSLKMCEARCKNFIVPDFETDDSINETISQTEADFTTSDKNVLSAFNTRPNPSLTFPINDKTTKSPQNFIVDATEAGNKVITYDIIEPIIPVTTANNLIEIDELSAGPALPNHECLFPLDVGPCSGVYKRSYFDTAQKLCSKFIYGGCGGNPNNFMSIEMCENKCKDFLEKKLNESTTLNKDSVHTPHIDEGTNDLNAVDESLCLLPMDFGPCSGMHKRFFFDYHINQCKEFRFGGCEGNANNFKSLEMCESKCKPSTRPSNVLNNSISTKSSKPQAYITEVNSEVVTKLPHDPFLTINPHCLAPLDIGPCSGIQKRSYFNSETNSCEEFLYGGCGGNGNNFLSKEMCEHRCKNRAIPHTSVTDDMPVPPISIVTKESNADAELKGTTQVHMIQKTKYTSSESKNLDENISKKVEEDNRISTKSINIEKIIKNAIDKYYKETAVIHQFLEAITTNKQIETSTADNGMSNLSTTEMFEKKPLHSEESRETSDEENSFVSNESSNTNLIPLTTKKQNDVLIVEEDDDTTVTRSDAVVVTKSSAQLDQGELLIKLYV